MGRDIETLDVPNPANVHAPLFDDFARSIIEDRRPRFDGRDGSAAGVDHGCSLSFGSGTGGMGGDCKQAAEGGCWRYVSVQQGEDAVVIFAPKPENDFAFFIRTYYERAAVVATRSKPSRESGCSATCCPGMSDFDARFIVPTT